MCIGIPPSQNSSCVSGVWVSTTSITLPIITQTEISSTWNISGDLTAQNGSVLTVSVVGNNNTPVIHVSGSHLSYSCGCGCYSASYLFSFSSEIFCSSSSKLISPLLGSANLTGVVLNLTIANNVVPQFIPLVTAQSFAGTVVQIMIVKRYRKFAFLFIGKILTYASPKSSGCTYQASSQLSQDGLTFGVLLTRSKNCTRSKVGLIVGITVGVALLVVVIVILIFTYLYRTGRYTRLWRSRPASVRRFSTKRDARGT